MITEILWLLTWPLLIAISLITILRILDRFEQNKDKTDQYSGKL